MNKTLPPCPFCGGDGGQFQRGHSNAPVRVECARCVYDVSRTVWLRRDGPPNTAMCREGSTTIDREPSIAP